MTRPGKPAPRYRDESGSDGTACPVCGGQGSQAGVWRHLRHDHGWSNERIHEAIGPHPYATAATTPGCAD
jgi:hypothetical protein